MNFVQYCRFVAKEADLARAADNLHMSKTTAQQQKLVKGGKREGAGRPPAPARPMPISWRPDTQAQRDMWLELGGARWVKRLLNETKLKYVQ